MTPPPPFDGRHLIAELHGCSALDDVALIDLTLRHAAAAAGATLIEVRLHSFGIGQGVTGVAMLAESHISIHTWPEYGYAAVDIFLCAPPDGLDAGLAVIAEALSARSVHRRILERGYSCAAATPAIAAE